MAAKKPKKTATPKKKKRKGGRLLKALLFILLIGAALWFSFDYWRGYYLAHITESVEEVVGSLDEEGVTVRVANEETANDLLGDLKSIQLRSLGLFSVKMDKRRAQRITGTLRLDKDTYAFTVIFLKGGAYSGAPKLAVIIDDMGQNASRDAKFLELDIPVTPAILPYLENSHETAILAAKKGREYLLHMPMEPKAGTEANPGEGAIRAGMDKGRVKALLSSALKSVGGVSGVNNHMGSRATEDGRVMEALMEELSARGLYFVDSMTTADSEGLKTADRYGVPELRRDVFLDNEPSEEAIGEKLEEAVDLALKRGRATAIGHSRAETLAALEKWQGKIRRSGVEVVTVKELLDSKESR